MEGTGRKKPAPKDRPPKDAPRKEKSRHLRKGVFRLDFKKGVEPVPAEITGPIVGIIPVTQYSYEIIWLEEEPPAEA